MKNTPYFMTDEALKFIKKKFQEAKILWTYHVNMRLQQRNITKANIISAIDSFEVIESYLGDKYLPSYLIWGTFNNRVFHVILAIDVEGNNVRVITAYFPDKKKWNSNFKQRRKK